MPSFFDAITQHLRPLQAEHCRCELAAPWAIRLPQGPGMRFHFVARGECTVRVAGHDAIRLAAGDLSLLPHASDHVIADPPDAVPRLLDELQPTPAGPCSYRLRTGGSGRAGLVLCGSMVFDPLTTRHIVSAMPAVLRVPGVRLRDPALAAAVEQMADEAAAPGFGTAAVMARPADLVVVRALRLWMEDNPGHAAGWIAAARDPAVARALTALHERPGEPWDVEALAAVAAVSRSTFSERFAAALGTSPARYVAQWRMQRAAELLRTTALTMAEIATRLGYESDASFSRSFKRIMGEAPSGVRRRASAQGVVRV